MKSVTLLMVIGIIVIWYAVHKIVYKGFTKKNIIIFITSSLILYTILCYSMTYLLNFSS